MPRPWTEVTADPSFQALPPAQQEAARNAYFQQNVLPNIPTGTNAGAIRLKFDQQTVPRAVSNPVAKPIPTPSDLVSASASSFLQHPLTTGVGALENVLGSVTRGAGSVADAVTGADPGAHDWAYQPRTEAGQQQAGILAGNAAQIGHAYDTTFGTGPLAQTLKERLPEAANAVGTVAGLRAPVEGLTSAIADPRIVTPEVAQATGAGFKLTPEQANAGITARAVQSLSGSAKLERSLSKQNAPIANTLAKDEIGVPQDQPLNASTLKQAKAAPNAIYDAVSKLGDVPVDAQFTADVANIANRTGAGSFGFDVPGSVDRLKTGYGGLQSFDAGDAVSKVRQLRSDASRNIKAQDPEQNALGYAQRQVGAALEGQLERYVGRLTQIPGSGVPPDLLSQFRDARMQLAKIHSVEDALDGSNVSPKALAKQQDRGVPLSGNLETIANAYQNFGRSFQDVSSLRDSGPFGVLDLGYGAAAGLAHPAAATAVLARPAARAVLASGPYQRLGIQGVPATSPRVQAMLAAQSSRISPQVQAMIAAARAASLQQPQQVP
jgi:hypothetical protein